MNPTDLRARCRPEATHPRAPCRLRGDIVLCILVALTGCATREHGGGPEIVDVGPLPARIEVSSDVIYRVELPADGFLAARREGAAGAEISTLCILADESATTCLDSGTTEAGAPLPAGVAHLVLVPDPAAPDLAVTATIDLQHTTPAALESSGLAPLAAADAVHAFGVAWKRGDTRRFEYAVTDFTLHSREPREWIFDLATGQLLHLLHVAHGRGSTTEGATGIAITFSNTPESHQSSLGMLRAGEPYTGDYGPSHRLDGLEPGINDNVRDRDIVMHPWEGSRPEYVAENGEAAPTWGCPAIDDRIAPEVRSRMAGGALMLFWHTDPAWRDVSIYLR